MALVLELHESGVETLEPGGGKGFERLRVGYSEVEFACEDQYGRIPLVDELVGEFSYERMAVAFSFSQYGPP